MRYMEWKKDIKEYIVDNQNSGWLVCKWNSSSKPGLCMVIDGKLKYIRGIYASVVDILPDFYIELL